MEIKINKYSSLYHDIKGFIKTRQFETGTKDTLKLRFDNIYETVNIDGRDNILRSEQLTKNGSQA